ncbi:MAG: hypothetical protein JWQ62_2758, partial [Lacunisphaera sp.]|nr:hypothetical protein [Lacunisphaera sp.]
MPSLRPAVRHALTGRTHPMEALLVLLALYLFLALVILPIWTIVKVNSQGAHLEALRRTIHQLE